MDIVNQITTHANHSHLGILSSNRPGLQVQVFEWPDNQDNNAHFDSPHSAARRSTLVDECRLSVISHRFAKLNQFDENGVGQRSGPC